MRVLPLSDFGLVTVPEACALRGWAAKSVQNWVRAGLMPAVVVGTGRSAKFLLRRSDVAAFVPPRRGPKPKPKPPPARATRRKPAGG